jgi:rhodanese-related sulfurtransferase
MIADDALKNYYPFNNMEEKFLPLLIKQFSEHEFLMNNDIFSHDDNKVFAKYVISGVVEITYPTGRKKLVKSTSMQSYYPIGEVNTLKKLSSQVKSKTATIMMIDNIFLDQFTVWNNLFRESSPTSNIRGHKSYNWVIGLLKSKAVQMLPRGHIDQLFKNLEPVNVSAGEEVITEGEAGDYCYVIVEGTADVYKCVAEGEDKVATLTEGSLFGDHALVSKEPRTASVRMSTDGVLMRMIGEKFSSLLKSHVVRWITTDTAVAEMKQGAILVDVREAEENLEFSVPGSINVPVDYLREFSGTELDINKTILTVSNSGLRCASAAFLLATLGYDVYSIQGGVAGLDKTMEKLNYSG